MIFEFGPCRIDVDVERTRRWYETAPTLSRCCDCDGCVNYERAADLFPERVTAFFAALGADVKKPTEVYVNCTNKDGSLWYGGWYHLCGMVLAEADWLFEAEGAPFGSRGFQIGLGGGGPIAREFPRPAITLDLWADIPWVLEKENTYEKDGE